MISMIQKMSNRHCSGNAKEVSCESWAKRHENVVLEDGIGLDQSKLW